MFEALVERGQSERGLLILAQDYAAERLKLWPLARSLDLTNRLSIVPELTERWDLTLEADALVIPIAKALIGLRSAVVIRTPAGDVRSRRIRAGSLRLIGLTQNAVIEVDQHHLETWEPGLCVVLYGSLLSCIRSLGGENAESSTRERDLFDKLCRLDPAAAMRLGGAQ